MSARLEQPAKFVLVGAGGFVLNVGVFTALFGLGAQYAAASAVAYLISNAAMYLGNRYFTFGLGNNGLLAAYVRYLLVGVIVAALTAAVLTVLVEGLAVDPRLGQAIALAIVTPVAFVLIKRWTFRLQPA
jgi:putative flippase GtrA